MTEAQITSRCMHCGCTKREHAIRKPYACRTRLADTHWKPWTVEAYRKAEEDGSFNCYSTEAEIARAMGRKLFDNE
jgi:hypothetical protein